MSWAVRNETRAQVGLPIAPEAMIFARLANGLKEARIFMHHEGNFGGAQFLRQSQTQSSKVGASGFCTIVGSLRAAAISDEASRAIPSS